MNYEHDPIKAAKNLETHGLDFSDAIHFDWSSAVIIKDERKDYSEERFIAYGLFFGRLTVMVYSPRSSATRLISWRKANSREVAMYEKA